MARTRKVRKGQRKSKAPKVSFDNRVLAVVNRKLETKKAVYQSGYVSFNGPWTATGDVLKIMPNIPTGSNSWQRVGQKIRLMKVVIRGHIMTSGAETLSSSRSRYGVRHAILSDKQKNDYTKVDTTDLGQALEGVSAAGQYFSGTISEYQTPINRENFTSRMDKKFPMTQILAEGNDGKSSLARSNIKFFTKTLTFGRNGRDIFFEGSNVPINFPYFMLLGYCYLDGSAADITSTDLRMAYTATAYYKD